METGNVWGVTPLGPESRYCCLECLDSYYGKETVLALWDNVFPVMDCLTGPNEELLVRAADPSVHVYCEDDLTREEYFGIFLYEVVSLFCYKCHSMVGWMTFVPNTTFPGRFLLDRSKLVLIDC